ncbi:Uu.00g115170.m01.CDS01 [Anthostomella pinea]|uniref:Uu.00g115170.m01.CDS01 n=1 Tax=Anthostomella pinea TaxID=933095 RepID=A0AAI8YEA7_9PEZI|nr:Uu.00g115170.m01.CDS01 [Anthostomella pinea]
MSILPGIATMPSSATEAAAIHALPVREVNAVPVAEAIPMPVTESIPTPVTETIALSGTRDFFRRAFPSDSEMDLDLSRRFEMGGETYMAGPTTQVKLSSIRSGSPIKYLTVLLHDDKNPSYITAEWFRQQIRDAKACDVVHDDFLECVLVMKVNPAVIVSDLAKMVLQSLRTDWVHSCPVQDGLSPGPYVVVQGELAPVWKLYDDTNGAFVHTFRPDSAGAINELRLGGTHPESMAVAIPSRLVHAQTDKRPLQGTRIAIKDIFKIRHIRNTLGNKAYYNLYPASTETAECVDLLTQAGAMIVGTTKLGSFTTAEEPSESIDYQAPWNPRGDGYQTPAGSSSGSAAAIAAYHWLDIAIGSDTVGGGRLPGVWNGCYAMRPTHGVLPAEGYIPSFPYFDTPMFYGRDIQECKKFAMAWYGKALEASPPKVTGKPAIIFPSDSMFKITNKAQINLIKAFIKDLETSLGVPHEKVSIKELWKSTAPREANGHPAALHMLDSVLNSFFYDDYHSFDRFRQDYAAKHTKEPYVTAPVRRRWEVSSHSTQGQRDSAVAKLAVYRKWMLEHVLKEGQKDALLLLPIEDMSPRYRDDPPKIDLATDLPDLHISPILGAPELTVPIGHVPYYSKVTGKMESLPVAISVLAAPGRDLQLFDVVQACLERAGRPLSVKTGSKMF